jgi:hypothetical protein
MKTLQRFQNSRPIRRGNITGQKLFIMEMYEREMNGSGKCCGL